jgi:hypothetical protein
VPGHQEGPLHSRAAALRPPPWLQVWDRVSVLSLIILFSRSIAEAYYCLGTAQAHQGSYAEAEINLNCAVAVLETRIVKLEDLGTSVFVAQEVEDLKEVIGDIEAKIVDHKNMAFAEVEVLKRKTSSSSPVGKYNKVAKLDTTTAEGRIKSAKLVMATGTAVA